MEKKSFDPCVNEEDILQFMWEVLLSFHLLFEQHGWAFKKAIPTDIQTNSYLLFV
jgi:hypothetical protein